MDLVIQQILDFFLNQGAAGGLVGAVLVLGASYFSVIDIGARKNRAIHKESIVAKIAFVLCGVLVGASIFMDHPSFGFIMYVASGAGWLYIVKGLVALGEAIGAAIKKKKELLEPLSSGSGN